MSKCKHGGCFDCGGGQEEVLTSLLTYRKVPATNEVRSMNVALCAACLKKEQAVERQAI